MHRRDVLQGIAGAGSLVLAGCGSDESSTPGDTSNGDQPGTGSSPSPDGNTSPQGSMGTVPSSYPRVAASPETYNCFGTNVEGEAVGRVTIGVKKPAQVDELDLRELTIQWDITEGPTYVTVSARSSRSADGSFALAHVKYGGDEPTFPVLSHEEDRADLIFDLGDSGPSIDDLANKPTPFGDNLVPDREVKLRAATEDGLVQFERLRTPEVITGDYTQTC